MLYLPKRSLFIHIPRTGGNAVTAAVASAAAGRGIDCVIATQPPMLGWPFHRHASLAEVEAYIPDLFDIYIWTVDRPYDQRLASYMRLVNRDRAAEIAEDPTCSDGWRETLKGSDEAAVAAFGRFQTEDYIKSFRGVSVDVIPYENLQARWPQLSWAVGIGHTELPVLP